MKAYEQLLWLLIFGSIAYLLYMVFFKKYRYLILILSSLILLGFASKWMMIFVLLSAFIVYLFARIMSQKNETIKNKKAEYDKETFKQEKLKTKKANKRILIVALILNLGLLISIKYLNFFDGILNSIFSICNWDFQIPMFKILMPLGISYYTLSNTGYLIDVYRGKYKASKNYLDILLFTAYFPCLLEGPISHYDQLLPQLKEPQSFRFEHFKKGLLLILVGLFKKIVIADRLAILVSQTFDKGVTGPILILGVIAFTFQLYTEFSGIIDMVRGVSKMYGIQLERNFEQPFFSSSVGEFWRRWHISLGTWFREYVFYPLSMSKPINWLCKVLRGKVSNFWETFLPSCVVLFVVWSLTGLWHGASFKYLIYGLYYYIVMMFENIIAHSFAHKIKHKTIFHILGIVKTFILVNIGMLIFRCNTLTDAGQYIINIFKPNSTNLTSIFEAKECIIAVLAIIILLVFEWLQTKKFDIYQRIVKLPRGIEYAAYLILIFGIIIFGAYGLGYIPPDPIYGGF